MRNLFLLATLATLSTPAFAAEKAYQVTGPVLEINESKIVVEKAKGKWEIARNAATKAPADIKVGDKVTIHYTMTATDIEAKGPKAATGEKPAKPAAK